MHISHAHRPRKWLHISYCSGVIEGDIIPKNFWSGTYHHLWTLEGPTQVVNRLVRCPEPSCASRGRTFSPEAALSISMPRWCLGWDVLCWLGHRRFARHWSVPQLRLELKDTHQIALSDDAIEHYIGLYQTMLAARQQDPDRLAEAYRDIESLVLRS